MKKPVKFTCKNCNTVIVIQPEWFNTKEKTKKHVCKKCGHTKNINTVKVREAKGYNFKKKTEKVSAKSSIEPEFKNIQLRIYPKKGNPESFILTQDIICIGRGFPTSSKIERDEKRRVVQKINIADEHVSSKHCEITIRHKDGKKKISIEDVGSLNKTFIDNNQLNEKEKIIIKIGQSITLGLSKIEIL